MITPLWLGKRCLIEKYISYSLTRKTSGPHHVRVKPINLSMTAGCERGGVWVWTHLRKDRSLRSRRSGLRIPESAEPNLRKSACCSEGPDCRRWGRWGETRSCKYGGEKTNTMTKTYKQINILKLTLAQNGDLFTDVRLYSNILNVNKSHGWSQIMNTMKCAILYKNYG